ncbi:hypothetical protein AB205_0108320, partial [Aquarana catesbeiana]
TIQYSHSTVINTLQTVYTVSNTVFTVSTTFLVVYTVSNTVCTVSTTLLVVYTIQCSCSPVSNTVQAVYTVSNTGCTVSTTLLVYTIQRVQFLLHLWWCTQYTIQAAVVQFLIQCRRCTQYLIQCSVVLQNKEYVMSGGPPRRGRCSQATKRGQAASVSTVNSGGCGHGASSPGGLGARLSFFSLAGRVIEPQHAEELVEWITKPSSSSSCSVTQAQSSLPLNAAAKAAYSTGSLSTVTTS